MILLFSGAPASDEVSPEVYAFQHAPHSECVGVFSVGLAIRKFDGRSRPDSEPEVMYLVSDGIDTYLAMTVPRQVCLNTLYLAEESRR